jgi:hypothetical protein
MPDAPGVFHPNTARGRSFAQPGPCLSALSPEGHGHHALYRPCPGTVYLIHFDIAYKHARHYTGKPESSGFLKVPRRVLAAGSANSHPDAQVTWRAWGIYPAGRVRRPCTSRVSSSAGRALAGSMRLPVGPVRQASTWSIIAA